MQRLGISVSVALASLTVFACSGSSVRNDRALSCASPPCADAGNHDGGGLPDGALPPDGAPPLDGSTPLDAGAFDGGSPPAACDFGERTDDFVVLASGDVRGVVVSPMHAYFTRAVASCTPKGCGNHITLYRMPRCGGTEELVLDPTPGTILPAAGLVYWAIGNELVRYHEQNGTTQVVDTKASCLQGLSANDAALFAWDRCSGAIMRMAHGETAFAPVVEGVSQPLRPTGPIAASATRVFYADAEGVGWASLDGSQRGRAFASTEMISWLAADERALFAVVGHFFTGQDVVRIPLDGGAPQKLTDLDAADRAPIVENGTAYWASGGSVHMMPTDAATPPEVAVPQGMNGFAVLGGRLYWVAEGNLLTGLRE